MVMKKNIAELREDYRLKTLDISDVNQDPFIQFQTWFDEALASDIPEPNAMVLATANTQGIPSARVVLLKGFHESGFVFYTNYESHKASELDANPFAALVFNWLGLQRQVRIEGSVERLSATASRSYFQSRPKGSQIGAYASPQSQEIPNRSVLEENVQKLQAQYADVEQLPLPDNWGGYLVKASKIEFWQGRSSRLHDRIVFTKVDTAWMTKRLAP